MIVDIIPMPLKIPPFTDINTESRFWVNSGTWYGSRVDEDLMHLGRVLDSSECVFRYKIIEARQGMMIERSVITLDELDTDYLSLAGDREVSIPIYPITTKVHKIRTGGVDVSAYRHLNSIKALLHRVYSTPSEDMYSVHQMYLHAMNNTTMAYDMWEVQSVLTKYAKENHYRLKTLVCANEYINTKLTSNISSMVDLQMELINTSLNPEEVIEGLEAVFKLPTLECYDGLSMHVTQKPCIDSHTLRKYLAPAYSSRHYSMSITTNDIFDIDESVIYEVPEELRWLTLPLINQLELLPYTDLSIGFTGKLGGKKHVNYAISHFGQVPDFSTVMCTEALGIDLNIHHLQNAFGDRYTILHDLNICLYKLISNLPIDAPLPDLNYNLVKTFQDDVYLYIHQISTGKCWKYYFDLTMYALGTRGIVSSTVLNQIPLSSYQPPNKLFDEMRASLINGGQLSYSRS
jgi:hypothetical protein